MTSVKKYAASLVLNGEMVVMGGYNEWNGWLSSVDVKPVGQEEFVERKEWEMKREMFNFCVVSYENKIYTIGKNPKPFLALQLVCIIKYFPHTSVLKDFVFLFD